MVALAVVVLAVVDLREVIKGYVALNRRVFGDLRGQPQDEALRRTQDEDRRDQ
jgi:hypothetical protein